MFSYEDIFPLEIKKKKTEILLTVRYPFINYFRFIKHSDPVPNSLIFFDKCNIDDAKVSLRDRFIF